MPRPRHLLTLLLIAAAALAATLGATGAGAASAGPTARAAADLSGWSTSAVSLRGRNGERFTVDCPKYGALSSVWGTDVYTDDSSICSAAVHAGVISLAGGGEVTFEIRPGQASYTGSVRNRVTSSSWGAYQGSFAIVAATPTYPGVGAGGSGWTASASQFRNWIGAQFEYACPPNPTILGTVWGTDVYTTDSSVCAAAVHSRLITRKRGGKVKIEIRDGQTSYRGSTRNSVQSRQWGAYDWSFVIVDAPGGPEDAQGTATGDVRVNGQPFRSGRIKYGSTIDVSRGTLTLTAAKVGNILTHGNGVDAAQFKLNKIVQQVKRKRVLTAELALTGGSFAACGTAGARASQNGKAVRTLWASGKGKFRTKGRFAAATVRGTKWATTDRCDGTLTSVTEGSVVVRDIPRKRNVVVSAGGSYLAKAP